MRVLIAALVCFGTALAACGGPNVPSAAERPFVATTAGLRAPYVYVTDGRFFTGTVAYSPGSTELARFYPSGGTALAFDRNGNLYVAQAGSGEVVVYPPDSTTPSRTIATGSGPVNALAFDAKENLYVPNQSATSFFKTGIVAVVPPGATSPKRVISTGIDRPNCLAVGSGNVYVSNAGSNDVTVYSAIDGSLIRTIANGVKNPSAIALDRNENLYVANQGAWTGKAFVRSTIAVYSPSATSPSLIINTVSAPDALRPDRAGHVYVALQQPDRTSPGSVVEYRVGSSKPIRTITNGIGKPNALDLDENGNLYVVNMAALGTGSVTIYPPNSSSPSRTLTALLLYPDAMALSSR